MTVMTSDGILERVRGICLSLDDTAERVSWGHPTFTVGGRTFAVFEEYKDEWCMCFRVEKAHQPLFLKDPRFFITPYIGKQGWLSLRVHASPLTWKEVRELLVESHRLVASAKTASSRRRG